MARPAARWILAGFWVGLGVVVFLVVRSWQPLYRDLSSAGLVSPVTQIVMSIGSVAWLVISIAMAGVALAPGLGQAGQEWLTWLLLCFILLAMIVLAVGFYPLSQVMTEIGSGASY